MDRRAWLGLLGWLAACFAVGALGGQFEPGHWYERLEKPAWTPPDRIFGPVWTFLYALMAVAAWWVWHVRGFSGASFALGAFIVQLVLNAGWSFLFFGLQRPELALVEIILLWATILVTIVAFWRIRPGAGGLLVPYLLWVTFATALNFEIWRLN